MDIIFSLQTYSRMLSMIFILSFRFNFFNYLVIYMLLSVFFFFRNFDVAISNLTKNFAQGTEYFKVRSKFVNCCNPDL